MNSEYNTLIISGGSVKAICSLGALQYCDDEKLIDNIDTYIGASAGAIIHINDLYYNVSKFTCWFLWT